MSDITLINDSEQSSLVTNGLAKNGEMYLKKAGSTDAGSIVVYDSGAWKSFANEYVAPSANNNELHYSGGLFTSAAAPYYVSAQPIMHFDAAILDGSNSANNPSSGLAVSTWGDRSGQATNYDATQATGSAQPTFNVSGDDKYVSFDGGDFVDFTDYTLPTAFNMVIVGNTNTDANHFLPIGTDTNGQYVILEFGGTTYGLKGTASAVDNTYGPNYNSITQFWATRDSNNLHNIYVQGANSLFSVTATNTRTVSRLGKGNNAYYHTGDIYELIIWASDLSTADKNKVNSYLANKYSSLQPLTSFS